MAEAYYTLDKYELSFYKEPCDYDEYDVGLTVGNMDIIDRNSKEVLGSMLFYIFPSLQEVSGYEIIEIADSVDGDTCDTVSSFWNFERSAWLKKVNSGLGKVIYISRLTINKEFRNKGIGSFVLDNIEKILHLVTEDYVETIIAEAAAFEYKKTDKFDKYTDRLLRWYIKHGFKTHNGNYIYKKFRSKAL